MIPIDYPTLWRYRQFFNDDFFAWLAPNEHVYDAFERQALALIAKGRTHYSARTIVEVLVHHSILAEAPGSEFKVRNDVAPDLARLFALRHPVHVEFWEYRRPDRIQFIEAVRRLQEAAA